MAHIYRKYFEHEFEAEEAAKSFFMTPGIDKIGNPKVSVSGVDGTHYVDVVLEGEYDPEKVLEATGYERVS